MVAGKNDSETKFRPFPAIPDGAVDHNRPKLTERDGNGRFPRL
jgi:hypothetical protein